jgi:hypothetical protein
MMNIIGTREIVSRLGSDIEGAAPEKSCRAPGERKRDNGQRCGRWPTEHTEHTEESILDPSSAEYAENRENLARFPRKIEAAGLNAAAWFDL